MRDRFTQLRARKLRLHLTDAERRLWPHLRLRRVSGHRFRRQVPIGPYIADFACLDPRIVVEVDGGQHALEKNYDTKRDAFLKEQGFRVLRFWANDVLTQTEAVLEVIYRATEETPPS
jgi:adenine-specific DNA-methyltransferase